MQIVPITNRLLLLRRFIVVLLLSIIFLGRNKSILVVVKKMLLKFAKSLGINLNLTIDAILSLLLRFTFHIQLVSFLIDLFWSFVVRILLMTILLLVCVFIFLLWLMQVLL